jgi:hypothetical protein
MKPTKEQTHAALEVWSTLMEEAFNSNTSDEKQIAGIAQALADAEERGIRRAAELPLIREELDNALAAASIHAKEHRKARDEGVALQKHVTKVEAALWNVRDTAMNGAHTAADFQAIVRYCTEALEHGRTLRKRSTPQE